MGRIVSFLWAAGAMSAAFALPASALAQTAVSEPSAQTAAPLPRDTRLAVDVALAELDLTKRALETLHPGYTRYTSAETLDALWEEARADVSQTPSRGRLYLAISRVLAAIRCDHTKAELPKDFEASRDQQPVYLPFRFKIFDDRIFVFNPGETGLERGAEVLSIDGRPVADVLSEVYALFPVDGDTDHIKPESVSEFGEFVGPAFEHFYPFLYPVNETVALEVAGEDGAAKAYELPRLTFAQYSAITSEKRFSANFDDAVTLKMMDDKTAYLSIDTFVNYRRPVDPDTIYAPVFAQLASSNTSTLILDLRRNGGGSTDAQIGLLQWLMDKPFQQASAVLVAADRIEPDLRQYLSSWEKAALDPDPAWFTARDDGMFEIALEQVGKPPASI
ncbi:MAG: S41 family peptidase, partial [Pseudomonadota bacterium]